VAAAACSSFEKDRRRILAKNVDPQSSMGSMVARCSPCCGGGGKRKRAKSHPDRNKDSDPLLLSGDKRGQHRASLDSSFTTSTVNNNTRPASNFVDYEGELERRLEGADEDERDVDEDQGSGSSDLIDLTGGRKKQPVSFEDPATTSEVDLLDLLLKEQEEQEAKRARLEAQQSQEKPRRSRSSPAPRLIEPPQSSSDQHLRQTDQHVRQTDQHLRQTEQHVTSRAWPQTAASANDGSDSGSIQQVQQASKASLTDTERELQEVVVV
jgi:hypothetical protein